MSPSLKSLVVVVILLLPIPARSQQYILVQKPGKHSEFVYPLGERISLGTSEGHLEGVITAIDTAGFVLNNKKIISYGEILYIRRHRFVPSLFASLGSAGFALYSSITLINRGINNDAPLIDRPSMTMMGSFALAGGLGLLLIRRQLWIDQGWTITVLDFNVTD